MGKLYVDPRIVVDGEDLSDGNFAHTVDMPFDTNEADVTGFRSLFTQALTGRRTGSITVGVWQDFDDTGIDDLLWGLWWDREEFPIVIEPTELPSVRYTFNVRLKSYNPLSGGVDDAADTTVEFVLSGDNSDPRERILSS